MNRIFYVWLVLGCLLTGTLSAQDSLLFELRGLVVDATTGSRLPDVQVHVKGSALSSMTNSDGRFSLKLRSVPEQLVLSGIGYSNRVLGRAAFEAYFAQDAGSRQELRIELQPKLTLLKDVFVYSPDNILEVALKQIDQNFPQVPQSYEAFYRETIKKRNNYVSVGEAVVSLYKGGYVESLTRSDMVSVRKGRSLMSQRAKDTVSVHVLGGPTEALSLDLVKNRELFLTPEVLRLYSLEIETPQTINNRPQYVIAFRPCYTSPDPMFTGRIYIDFATLSFTRIEYNMDMSDPDKATNAILARKPLGMRFRTKGFEVVMNYHYDGALSHLQYMRTTYRFDCDWKKRGFATRYEAVSEMLVTDILPEAVRPSRKEAFRASEVLAKQLSDFADEDFWADYNILLPSESLEHAFRRLKKTYVTK